MPLMKTCAMCGKLFNYDNSSYCDRCKPIAERRRERYLKERKKKRDKIYNQSRDKRYTAFYKSKDWIILSRKYAADKKYRCERCGKIGENVHHKLPIQTPDGWQRRLDYNGLELLCIDCHNDAHSRFRKKKKRNNTLN